jgi:Cft2 family RNA processing exonuclease
MKIPTQNDLACPLALTKLIKKLWNGESHGIEKLSPLLFQLGYWSHWPSDVYHQEDIEEIIKEGLEIPHIWDRFLSLSENQRWQFGNHEILKRHPAYKDGGRISQAALVALNPHAMPSNVDVPSDPKIGIEFMGLGGCETIGASCYAYRTGNDVILVDLGINPDTNTLPDIEKLPEDWKADLRGIVLSHLHADHASGLLHLDSLGFIGEQYLGRDLPIYCTEVTKQLFSHVLRIGTKNEFSPWDADERLQLLEKCLCPLETGVWHNLPENLSLKLIEQPHVPGAALIEIEGSDGRLLHAVDFAMDRSLGGDPLDLGWLESEEISVVILESTYGHVTSEGHLRQLRIPALFNCFMDFLDQQFEGKRARVLFPAFSLGRAQELTDRLEQGNPETTILGGAAKGISRLVHEIDPKWMNSYSDLSESYIGYRNIVASHGWMLNGTKSHEYYKGLRRDDAVVFTGYIKGDTPAHLLTEPKRPSEGPRIVALPFSSHASLSQLLALVTASGAGRVVLVHGERIPNSELSIDYLLWKNEIAVERPRASEMLTL